MIMRFKRKKNIRQRGSKTHGWGSMKKHRGAGNRGGRGMAGSGKRGDSKKPSVWKDQKYFGKHGFKRKCIVKEVNAVNIAWLEDKAESIAKKENDVYIIDLSNLGIDKLLSSGKAIKKFNITVEKATPNAVKRVEEAGGKVTVTLKKGEVKE